MQGFWKQERLFTRSVEVVDTIFDEDGLTLKVEELDEAVVRLKRRRKERFGTGLSSRSQANYSLGLSSLGAEI